jgi:uncharacterized UPF0160 family protein
MKVGTHNGLHHPDDVIACSILNKIFDGVEIIRSRNPNELKECSVLIDVGGKYEPPTHFDHHQANGPKRDNGIPFSSCGLIWSHYGRDFIAKVLENKNVSAIDIDEIFHNIDDNFILYVDKVDNQLVKPDSTSVNEYIMMMNDEGSLDAFNQAMSFMENYLTTTVKKEYKLVKDQKYLLDLAYKSRLNGENYIVSDREVDTTCLKEKHGIDFVIYPSMDKQTMMLKCLPFDHDSVTPRFPFDEKWRGLRTDSLLEAGAKVGDAIFVHQKGFCGGAKTLEGALSMMEMTKNNYMHQTYDVSQSHAYH